MSSSRIFSGIQPSGELHIGNYLGAVKNWVSLQRPYESFFCIVDYHAITVPYEPEDLRRRTRDMAISLVAAGVDSVIICGVSTSGCIRASATNAMQHGFIPLVVREAVGDRHPGPHEANLFDIDAKIGDVVSEAETIAHLGGLA